VDGSWKQTQEHSRLTDLQGLWPTDAGLWIATRDSLYVLRDAGKPAEPVTQSRAWMPVHGIHPLRDDILVATDHGLIVCDKTGQPRTFYNRDSGIETPAIGAIEADDQTIWLGTLGGGLVSIESAALSPAKEPNQATQTTGMPGGEQN
jgi:ligand-binding sensor domain-containing protein